MTTQELCDDAERLKALYSYRILDTPIEPNFDELTALAAELFAAPIAVINLIDRDRQWFKSEIGLGVRETPLETSFCRHALLQQDLMIIPDARADQRFANNPLVTGEPQLRFYAGALLKSRDQQPIGTLCILDYHSREFSEAQKHTLQVLAKQVMAQLEQKRLLHESEVARHELARANTRLQQRDQSKDQFLAMISHELRNPLSPILMSLDMLSLTGPHDEHIANGLATIQRQTEHLVRLVDDMMDVSRVATGKISLRRSTVRLADIIGRSVEIAKSAADLKQQTLTISLPEQVVWLNVDEIRICQLFSNLINNAIRYTAEVGTIALTAERQDDDTIRVTVKDNGIGIAGDYLERIFESFVQVPQPEEQTSGGLGIGLHLCKHIVQLHGGTIVAASDGVGRGSRFTVILPTVSGPR